MIPNNKILFISHSAEIGGASRSLLYMAEGFKDRCQVLLPKNGPINKLYIEAGIRVKIIRVPALFYSQYSKLSLESVAGFFYHIKGMIQLVMHLKNRRYEIVHFNELVFAPVAAFIKKCFGNKLKIIIHSRIELPYGQTGFIQRIYKRWMKRLDFGIAIGNFELNSFPSSLPQKIVMNPVDFGNYTPLYAKSDFLFREFKINSNQIIVGLLGVIHKGKGQAMLISALLEENITNTTFVIIGSGPLSDQLKKISSPLHNVIFTGQVVCPYKYIESCDYIIRLEENGLLGRDVLEANALGVPVLAYVRNKELYKMLVNEDINAVLIDDLSNKSIISGILAMNKKYNTLRNNSIKLNYGFKSRESYQKEIASIYASLF